jgi:hypothetical protein
MSASDLASIFQSAVRVDITELSPDNTFRQKTERSVALFTEGVRIIKEMGNPRLSTLAETVWDLFHYKYLPLVYGMPVPTLFFAVTTSQEAFVLIPEDWIVAVETEPIMQLGAIVFIGSQVVDWYNKRLPLESAEMIRQRAHAYEAEYLRWFVDESALNGYQKAVLSEFPGGFDASLGYQAKAVMPME